MKGGRGSTVEVESLDEFDSRVAAGATSLGGWHLQSIDLTARGGVLRELDPAGALFLGCALDRADEQSLRDRGALIFPVVPAVPIDPYRGRLYTAEELYAGLGTGYEHTLDARVYAWSQQPATLDVTLARALHDHAIDDALHDLVPGRRLVGVMGGHAAARGSTTYADAARLGQQLARAGLTVLTGGGPGAMEAANLGAYLADRSPGELGEALATLAAVPGFVPSVSDWARVAFDVRARWPRGTRSVGIPTWHYGHEPPNVFATDIAKYLRNAIREDVLLQLATAGIVFLPGAGGTVQEIFQDACENYYADPSSVAPMVLVGRSYWTEAVPAWPLLQSLARGREMADSIHLVDDVAEVPPLLAQS
ncbi:LOG family protein [Georgenia thermotolerans]|uniref:Rossmann fold nucleotide-binding protein n=1 Tax=Georgenia thermotolerans TaxID=527326 RepID=A0A7J5URL9_9MICO|nr:LOG family protein [Georgenia thermotolerans]KAE8765028.1 Rossmann fold nucleotide-binding protein [Georgenia thermotolerans]